MAKFNELNTKSFLSEQGAINNTYVLINYSDNQNQQPTTCKASLAEVGQALAAYYGFAMNSSESLMSFTPNFNKQSYDQNVILDISSSSSSDSSDTPTNNTFDITASFPFVADEGVPDSIPDPSLSKAYLVFAPYESGTVGPPFIHKDGDDYATPLNLAGPFMARHNGDYEEYTNIFTNTSKDCYFTIGEQGVEEVNLSNYVFQQGMTRNDDRFLPIVQDDYSGQLYAVNNSMLDDLDLSETIKTTSIDYDDLTLQPLFIDDSNNRLYRYTLSGWQEVSI